MLYTENLYYVYRDLFFIQSETIEVTGFYNVVVYTISSEFSDL